MLIVFIFIYFYIYVLIRIITIFFLIFIVIDTSTHSIMQIQLLISIIPLSVSFTRHQQEKKVARQINLSALYVSHTHIYGNLSIKHNYRALSHSVCLLCVNFSSPKRVCVTNTSTADAAIDLSLLLCCIDTRIIYGNLYRNKSQILQWHHPQRVPSLCACVDCNNTINPSMTYYLISCTSRHKGRGASSMTVIAMKLHLWVLFSTSSAANDDELWTRETFKVQLIVDPQFPIPARASNVLYFIFLLLQKNLWNFLRVSSSHTHTECNTMKGGGKMYFMIAGEKNLQVIKI